jgi:hypothetical protein
MTTLEQAVRCNLERSAIIASVTIARRHADIVRAYPWASPLSPWAVYILELETALDVNMEPLRWHY